MSREDARQEDPAGLSTQRIFRILLLALFGLLAVIVELAPTGFGPRDRPSPDLLFCIVAYWAVRRPGSAPVLVIFALGISRDLLADVPVGAGALSLILATEFLRSRGKTLQRQNFLAEWATVAACGAVMIAFQYVIVALLMVQPPYMLDLVRQGLYTAAIYPVVALVLRWVVRIGWRGARKARDERRRLAGQGV